MVKKESKEKLAEETKSKEKNKSLKRVHELSIELSNLLETARAKKHHVVVASLGLLSMTFSMQISDAMTELQPKIRKE